MRAIDSPHEIAPRNIILRQKFQNFSIFVSICTLQFPDSGSEKRFQVLRMRAIDSPHKISPNRVIFEKKLSDHISDLFLWPRPLNSNQGAVPLSQVHVQIRIFNFAYNFFRIELVLIGSILKKNFWVEKT